MQMVVQWVLFRNVVVRVVGIILKFEKINFKKNRFLYKNGNSLENRTSTRLYENGSPESPLSNLSVLRWLV